MKTALLIIAAWVAVSLALPGLFCWFRIIRTARRMAQRRAMMDRVLNASARYDRVLTMTDSAATRRVLSSHPRMMLDDAYIYQEDGRPLMLRTPTRPEDGL